MLLQTLNRLSVIKSLILFVILCFVISSSTLAAENKKKGFCKAKNYFFCNVTPFKMYDTIEELQDDMITSYRYYGEDNTYVRHGFNNPAFPIKCNDNEDCIFSLGSTYIDVYSNILDRWVNRITVYEVYEFDLVCNFPYNEEWVEPGVPRCTAYCPKNVEILNLTSGKCKAKPGVKKKEAPLICDPIYADTGESFQPQSPDYIGGGAFPLRFSRNYKSYRAPEVPRFRKLHDIANMKQYIQPKGYAGTSNPNFPSISSNISYDIPDVGFKQWQHNYQLSLFAPADNSQVVLTRSSGEQVFLLPLEDGITFMPDNLTGDKVVKTTTQWLYTNPEGIVESYDLAGKLIQITNQQGLTQTLSYGSNGKLANVTDAGGRQLTFSYDAQNRLSALLLPDGASTQYQYGLYGNLTQVIYPDNTPNDLTDNPTLHYGYTSASQPYALTSQVDENANLYATWTFDDAGRATGSSNFGGHQAGSIDYVDGNVTVTEANGQARTLNFDVYGRLSSVVGGNCSACGDGDTATYQHSPTTGLLWRKVNYNGVETWYTHNEHGLETKRTEAYGTSLARVISTEWHNELSLPIKITTPVMQTDYQYGLRGRLEVITEKDILVSTTPVRVTTYNYNEAGLLTSIDGPRTDVIDTTNFTYNANYDLIKITDAVGNITQITGHDAHGHPTSIIDANGIITTLTYDVRNRLVSQKVAGNLTSFSYDNIGQLVKVTLPSGAISFYEYSGARLLTAMADGQGNRVEYSHDLMGNVVKVEIKDPDGVLHARQQQIYDGLNRLSIQIDGLNQSTSFGYDAIGNQISVKKPALKETKQVYDALNRIIETEDAKTQKTIFTFDVGNNLTQVTAANSAVTSYSYNGFGELLSQTSPDTGTTVFTYDATGNQLSKKDARGLTTSYQYDVLNRLTSIDYNDDTLDVVLSYDVGINAKGRLAKISDGSGTTTYSYNALGQVSSKTSLVAGKSFMVGYGYDGAGQLTQITQPSGRIINLTRDSHGIVTGISELKAGVTSNLLTNAHYAPFGLAQSFVLGNGKTTTKTHNLNGQLASIDVNGVYQSQLVYNNDSQITQLQNPLQPSLQQDFSYDQLNQLTQAYGSYGDLTYGYDSAGNRLNKTTNEQAVLLNYSLNSNQLNTPYLHDANGNRTEDNQRSYVYGENNRLSETVNDVDGIKTTYLYNGLGQRVKKSNVFGTNYYLYDESGLLMAEANNSGSIIKEYVYFEGQPLVMLVGE